MSVLRNALIFVALVSFLTFVGLFGRLPALRKTPIGWIQRLLCIHIPQGLKKVDSRITGGQVSRQGRVLGQYLFYKKNPVVLVRTLAACAFGMAPELIIGSSILFLLHAISQLPASLLVPIPVLLFLPYLFTYLCVAHTGHYITGSNHQTRMRDYPYDHILYRPQKRCNTCDRVKPARSKHCSLCNACVAKCDHHCPWVNACLGRGNYRWFLALLLSLTVLEYYGSFLSWYILRSELQFDHSSPMLSTAFAHSALDTISKAVTKGGLSIAGVGMLTISTAALPLGLLIYHLYLIWAGTTTNESQKWGDWKEDMEDGYGFIASRELVREYNNDLLAPESKEGAAGRGLSAALGLDTTDEDEPHVVWPVKSDQIMVRTDDGMPPTGQEHLWRRVRRLNGIDNIYDLGWLANFVEVLNGR